VNNIKFIINVVVIYIDLSCFFQELSAVNNLQEPEYIFLSSMLNPSHDKIFTVQSNFEVEQKNYKKNTILQKEWYIEIKSFD